MEMAEWGTRIPSEDSQSLDDHGAGEFGKAITATKYFHDKRKLVLNGIIQLDNLLNNCDCDSSIIKLPLFQALGNLRIKR